MLEIQASLNPTKLNSGSFLSNSFICLAYPGSMETPHITLKNDFIFFTVIDKERTDSLKSRIKESKNEIYS